MDETKASSVPNQDVLSGINSPSFATMLGATGSPSSFSASLQSFQTSMMQPNDALYRKLINQAANAPSTAALLGDLTKFDTKDTISPKMVMKKTPSKGICNVEGCERRIRSRGLCKSHGGMVPGHVGYKFYHFVIGGKKCTMPGCTKGADNGNFCIGKPPSLLVKCGKFINV